MSTSVEEATKIILNGGIVAMPTETVYGLAADATNDTAIAKVFEAKGRPAFNPLICHVSDLPMAQRVGLFDEISLSLAKVFWPGPLTLVVPINPDAPLSLLVTAGLETVAIRIPDHPIAQNLIKAVGQPLAAPSANASGTISPTKLTHVREGLGDKVNLLIDGGPTHVGLESTIIRVIDEDVILLRSGGIDRNALEKAVGKALMSPKEKTIQSPGMMRSHYAPKTPLRINVARPAKDEAFLDFGATYKDHLERLDLSATGNIREATANLYAHLHSLDDICQRKSLTGISVASIPNEGLGEAINDRLNRAAAKK